MNRPPARALGHLALFVGTPLLLLLAAALVSLHAAIPIERFTRDPADLAMQHPLWGVLSNVGVLLWCVCASVCAFAGQSLRRREGRVTQRVRHLRAAALLTVALLLDDLFMLHDELAGRYLDAGEPLVVALLAAAAVAYFWRYGRAILASGSGLLLFGLACLIASLLVDQANDAGLLGASAWAFFAEDAPKLLGIFAWCGYHYRLALDALAPAALRAAASADESRPGDLETPRIAA